MRGKYDNEFKVMVVELLKAGQTVKNVGAEYSLNDGMIRRWRREFEAKQGDFSKKKELSSDELEIKRLKKEMADIKMERDILKKAVSIFSKSDK